MRRAVILAGVGVAAALALVWALGGLEMLGRWAAEVQRSLQAPLAGAVRAVKAGEPAAWAGLLSVCFLYGLAHAAGPGHGKFLIGGYGVARRVRLGPLAGVALASSLAQAGVAVALVYAGVLALGWTRERMVGLAEGGLAMASWAAIAGIGFWLVWRGARGVWRGVQADAEKGSDHDHHHHDHHHHDHGHKHHDHGPDCGCGHAHGPTVEEVARLTGWRDTAALIASVAVRPCSGALFLLILTFQLGIGAAGVAGAFAMGLGVAVVTIGVAVLAVWSREGALAGLGEARIWRLMPVLELAAGAVIAALALGMLGALV
jgi:ABC-type nickel/cobalt efflux system permease component RcnA